LGCLRCIAFFQDRYLAAKGRWNLGNYQVSREDVVDKLEAQLQEGSTVHTLSGPGNGVVASFVEAMQGFTHPPTRPA